MSWSLGSLIILAMVLRHLKAILTFVFFAYLWGNVCECCPYFVFVRVCVYYGAFCLLFYLVCIVHYSFQSEKVATNLIMFSALQCSSNDDLLGLYSM